MKKLIILILALLIATQCFADFAQTSLCKGLVGQWSLSKSSTQAGDDLNTESNAVAVTTEADTTTGWSNGGLENGANVFQSQSSVVSDGTYAFEASANDSPTGAARFYQNMKNIYSFSDGDIVNVQFDARHVGSGGDWVIGIGPESFSVSDGATIDNASTTWTTYSTTFTVSDDADFFVARENSETNDGGVYVDKLIVKDATGKVIDKTPYSNHGSRVGTTWATGRNGVSNNALDFNGSSDYINIGDASTLDFERTDSFSAFAWVKSDTSSTNIDVILGKQDNANDKNGWILATTRNDDKLCVTLSNNHSPINRIIVYGHTAVGGSGAWHHVGFTYDGSSSASGVNIYVNGALETMSTLNDSLSATIKNSASASIGSRNNANDYFDGDIHNIIVFNRELSSIEALAIYKLKPNPTVELP